MRLHLTCSTFQFILLKASIEAQPLKQLELQVQNPSEDWTRAWHGTKMEALYSIMFFGRLFESRQTHKGERHFEGALAVYLHKDETAKQFLSITSVFVYLAKGTRYTLLSPRLSPCGLAKLI